jgi:hypothetical protein
MSPFRTALPLIVAALPAAATADTTVTTFSSGAQGWYVSGGGSIPATGGNPGHCQRILFNDFGVGCANATNAPYLGDYTTAESVTIKIDLKVSQVSFFGQPVSRPWLVELRDLDGASGGYPYNSVYFVFANVSAATHGSWTTFSVTFDPSSTTLPPGWGGTGAEDPVTYEPILPPGVTFADVLAGVDRIVFTTLQPGYFFGFTDFDLRMDNITIVRTAPNPADLDGNGSVGPSDLAILLGAWGACPPKGSCVADLDADGQVGPADLSALLAAWT